MLVFRGWKFSFSFLRLHGHWNPALMHPDEAGAHAPRRIGSHVLGDAGGDHLECFIWIYLLKWPYSKHCTLCKPSFSVSIVSCPWMSPLYSLCQGKTAWFPTCTKCQGVYLIAFSLPALVATVQLLGALRCEMMVSNMFVFTPTWGNDLQYIISSNLTNMFKGGWNHQLGICLMCLNVYFAVGPPSKPITDFIVPSIDALMGINSSLGRMENCPKLMAIELEILLMEEIRLTTCIKACK